MAGHSGRVQGPRHVDQPQHQLHLVIRQGPALDLIILSLISFPQPQLLLSDLIAMRVQQANGVRCEDSFIGR